MTNNYGTTLKFLYNRILGSLYQRDQRPTGEMRHTCEIACITISNFGAMSLASLTFESSDVELRYEMNETGKLHL